MKIHLISLRQSAYDAMVGLYELSEPRLHDLVNDPETAEMILFVGDWPAHGEGVVDSPVAKKYPEKCFMYYDSDGFVPLLPGIYANAETKLLSLHRGESQMFITALNPHVTRPMDVPKRYLFSFAGGSTSLLRKKLYKVKFQRPDVLIENTSNYYHWDPSQAGREERQKQYAETIASSHFGLCPRGASAGGLRLFEVMQMGVAPVVVSDSQMLPVGPDWERFAIRVPERKIKELDTIVARYQSESVERGRLAREAYEQWFAPPVLFNRLVEACERIRSKRKISERWVQPFWGFMLWRRRFKGQIRGVVKSTVLWGFKLMGRRFVYDLNER